MIPEQIYGVWAPENSPWAAWVSPVVFPSLHVTSSTDELATDPAAAEICRAEPFSKTAFVLDLPGATSVATGIAMVRHGYRPVPVFSGAPGPTRLDPGERTTVDGIPERHSLQGGVSFCVVDMSPLVKAMQQATATLLQSQVPSEAPPVFLLDSLRLFGHRPPTPSLFDNRWMVFPQDFPSALFLRSRGIERVVLVQENHLEPQDDLKHVLRRWQDAGIEVRAVKHLSVHGSQTILVARPWRFKALWHRALAIWGLRRNSAGGFGSIIPEPSSGGGFG